MRCPVCHAENFEGVDYCVECHADLVGADIPQPATEFEGRLLGKHLDALGLAEPIAIGPTETVAAAIDRMRATRRDCLLVMDGRQLVGVFTERDAVLKVAGRPTGSIAVGNVMTHDPVVLRHDDTLAVAINKMAIGGFRHVPLLDDEGAPMAVVAAADIFRHMLETVG